MSFKVAQVTLVQHSQSSAPGVRCMVSVPGIDLDRAPGSRDGAETERRFAGAEVGDVDDVGKRQAHEVRSPSLTFRAQQHWGAELSGTRLQLIVARRF